MTETADILPVFSSYASAASEVDGRTETKFGSKTIMVAAQIAVFLSSQPQARRQLPVACKNEKIRAPCSSMMHPIPNKLLGRSFTKLCKDCGLYVAGLLMNQMNGARLTQGLPVYFSFWTISEKTLLTLLSLSGVFRSSLWDLRISTLVPRMRTSFLLE